MTNAAPLAKHGPAAFTSKRWQFTIAQPVGWSLQHDFSKSYLQSGTWKTYAGPDSRGTPVLALTVPGSNSITDAELRIGVSKAPTEVATCTTPPDSVRAGSVAKTTINDIAFTRFEAADAAMSHYLDVHSYRVVHNHACYAIDLLVYGTNPEVYDPPATPPFTRQQAFAQLQQALQGFRFTR